MRYLLVIVGLACAAAAAGCAGTQPLHSEASTSAISAAEAVGAGEVPRAALHLQLAREELERAQVLSGKGDKDEAASMLLRAEADAELAGILSRESSEKADATAAMERVHQLQMDNR